MSLLKVDNLHVYYGSIHAIKGVSFEVHEGECETGVVEGKRRFSCSLLPVLSGASGSVCLSLVARPFSLSDIVSGVRDTCH